MKIEEGKYYKRRNGDIVYCVFVDGSFAHVWDNAAPDPYLVDKDTGVFQFGDFPAYDLVEEYLGL